MCALLIATTSIQGSTTVRTTCCINVLLAVWRTAEAMRICMPSLFRNSDRYSLERGGCTHYQVSRMAVVV